MPPTLRLTLPAVLAAAVLWTAVPARAQTYPYEQVVSRYDFDETLTRLQRAIDLSPLEIVMRLSVGREAAVQGAAVAGNEVWGLYSPDYAVRIAQASLRAGFEAPLRLYVLESSEGDVLVRYKRPTRLFAPYGSAELDATARGLDFIFAGIVRTLR